MAEEAKAEVIIENLKAKIVEFEKKEKKFAERIQKVLDMLRRERNSAESSRNRNARSVAEKLHSTDENVLIARRIDNEFFISNQAKVDAFEGAINIVDSQRW